MNAPMNGSRHASSPLGRAEESLLLGTLVIGGLAMWTLLPLGILWALGGVAASVTQHFVLALLAIPVGMIVFAVLLAQINGRYLYLRGLQPAGDDAGDDEDWTPTFRGPLERILTAGAILALILLLAWMTVGPEGTNAPAFW